MGKPLQGHTKSVNSVALSPHGRHIVSGSDDRTIQIWNVKTGDQVGKPLQGHTKSVKSVAFSPDGRHIVSGSDDRTIQIWDAQTGDQVGIPLQGNTDSVNTVASLPNERRNVSGSKYYTFQLWDAETGDEVNNPIQRHIDLVNSVAFSPDGRHIVSGSIDGTIQLWKAQTDQVAKPLQEQSSSVTSDRMVNVSDSEDNTSAQTGGEVDNPLQGHTWSVNSVAFSPDGRYIVSGSVDGAIQLWETQSGGQVADSLQENTSVNSAAFSQYRKDNWLDSWDKAIKVWGAQMGGELCDALNEQSTAHALHDAQSLFDDVSNFNGDYQDLIHLQHDGWIVGPNGKLFLWVPPSYCKYFLYTPWTRLIIPKGKI